MMAGMLEQRMGYPVYIILSKLDTDIPENILGFHSQTVCDTSSSFSGISKIKHVGSSTSRKLRNCYSHYVKDLSLFLPVWQLRC